MIARLWRNRSLLVSMIRRQYQLRYRQSFMGWVWAFVPPLVGTVVGTVVFHRVAGIETGNVPYPLFVMAGLVPWTFFSSSLVLGVPSLVQMTQTISRVPFPRAVVPLSMVGLAFLDLIVALLVFVVAAFLLGQGALMTWFAVPAILAVETVLTIGVVLFASGLNMFARDIRLAVPMAVQLWLFLTPVMYPLESVPQSLRLMYMLNPMTGVIESFRDVLVMGQLPSTEIWGQALLSAAIFFAIGTWYFAATEPRFADVI